MDQLERADNLLFEILQSKTTKEFINQECKNLQSSQSFFFGKLLELLFEIYNFSLDEMAKRAEKAKEFHHSEKLKSFKIDPSEKEKEEVLVNPLAIKISSEFLNQIWNEIFQNAESCFSSFLDRVELGQKSSTIH